MFFQLVLKGIQGDDDQHAQYQLRQGGIICRWWSLVNLISPDQVKAKLSLRNLEWHLNRYSDPDPENNDEPFCNHTPYISTTAGSVERDAMLRKNRVYSPFLTALLFATDWLSKTGYVYYGYVYTLGKKAVELEEFSEEVRDLLVYTNFLPFHAEGEIVAKVHIPSVNLKKYEKYDGAQALNDLRRGIRPTPIDRQFNSDFAEPERFLNLRGFVE